jgi:hypothetical protein
LRWIKDNATVMIAPPDFVRRLRVGGPRFGHPAAGFDLRDDAAFG